MSFQSIVVGTDGSETAKKAVEQAADLAKTAGGELHIVMAASTVPEARLRSERAGAPDDVAHTITATEDTEAELKDVASQYEGDGLKVHTHAKSGDPADAIIDVAESNGADLIVVGNKGMTGAKRFFLGAVPNKISHHAPCSVLIVRTT
jgi:nucleotide-binding universal stress UspA family protein